jgi:hypothetical protein
MTPKLLGAVVLDSVGFDGLQCLLDLLDLRGPIAHFLDFIS